MQPRFGQSLGILVHQPVDLPRHGLKVLDGTVRQMRQMTGGDGGNIRCQLPQRAEAIAHLKQDAADQHGAQQRHGRHQPEQRAPGRLGEGCRRCRDQNVERFVGNDRAQRAQMQALAPERLAVTRLRAALQNVAPGEGRRRAVDAAIAERAGGEARAIPGDLPVPAGAAAIEGRAVERGGEDHGAVGVGGQCAAQAFHLRVEALVDLVAHHAGDDLVENDRGQNDRRGHEQHGETGEPAADRHPAKGPATAHGCAVSI